MKINCNIDEKMTFKYKERKVKERRYDRCPVSKNYEEYFERDL